jgi:hypothetical protein
MTLTENLIDGSGSNTYNFTFPILDLQDVKVQLREFDPNLPPEDQIVSQISTTAFDVFSSPNRVVFQPIANETIYQDANGDVKVTSSNGYQVVIRIYRDTDIDSTAAYFYPGSAIRAEDLNDNFKQLIFSAQETDAELEDVLAGIFPDDSIPGSALKDGAVTTDKIADGAVTPEKLDREYVQKTGDNMTGDLTVSTTGDSDNQVLLDSRGAILAFRETQASTWSALSSASAIVPSGGYQILSGGNYDAGTRVPTSWINSNGSAYFQGTVGIGGTLPSSPNIELSSSGSADFAGVVSSGPISVGTASSTALGVQLSSGGLIRVQRPSTASASTPVFSGFNGNTENITLTSGGSATFVGNVGIGTDNPKGKLEVFSAAVDSEVMNLRGFNNTRGLNVSIFTEGGVTDSLVDFNNELSNGRISWSLGGDEKMRIDAAGNVGINTEDPRATLEVTGNSSFTGPDGAGTVNIVATANVAGAGNKIAFFGADRLDTDEEMAYIKPLLQGNQGGSGNVQTGNLAFGTSGNEAMRIRYDGNVGIGTNTPNEKLVVNGTAKFNGNVTLPGGGGDTQALQKQEIEDLISAGGGGGSGSGADAWGSVSSTGILQNGQNIASTSLTSIGTFQVTFSTPMPNANYSVTTGGQTGMIRALSKTVNGFVIETYADQTTKASVQFNFAVFATNAIPPTGGTGTDAWAKCNGIGSFNASYNFASISRFDLGRYSLIFANPMPTAEYAVLTSSDDAHGQIRTYNKSTIGFSVECATVGVTGTVDANFSVAVNATNATLPATLTQDMIVMKSGDTMSGDLEIDDADIILNDSGGDPRVSFQGAAGTGFFTGNLSCGRLTFPGVSNGFAWDWTPNSGGRLLQYVDNTPIGYLTYSSNNNIVLSWSTSSQVLATIDGTTSVLLGTASDYRLKENDRDCEYGTDAVKALRPVTYEISESGATQTGFIAHEAAEVIPGAATGEKDGELYQSINTYPIVAALTKALQESIERIETLEAKVQTLENN